MPSAIAAVALSVWLYGNKRSPGFYFLILSFMLLLVTLLVTLLVLVPIDNDIKHWTVATIPENWQSIRDHWADYHTARTITSLSALMCFVLSVLTGR